MEQVFEVVVLAVVQGLTEFLPVSSSGHLAVGQRLLGFNPQGLDLEVFLHGGTLLAVAGFYRRRIGELVRARDWRTGGALVVSGVPAIGVYAVVKDWLEGFSSDMGCVGIAMLFTGLVLCTTRFLRLAPSGRKGGYLEALLIGCAQAVALFPGVSRSGMTISAARALRLEPEKAAEFSFLMSLPIIGGATVLHLVELVRRPAEATLPPGTLLLGAAVAGIVGYFAILAVERLLGSGRFWLFGPYCLACGLLVICFL
ncbi:MAG: undecaprenyl-diphosphate phosphatase [Kiritimatiellia bacterium]|nr:undecaprenyl-diphosphate phosphatase [Kiritimatiellia bacterium]